MWVQMQVELTFSKACHMQVTCRRGININSLVQSACIVQRAEGLSRMKGTRLLKNINATVSAFIDKDLVKL